ncbi:MAG: arylformamidase [Pseudomonadota bacterium]|nr:arylformamidase [Tepidimonas thermarum]
MPASDPCTTRRLWDISPPVDAQAPVFPGDTPYQQRWVATIGPGCPVNVSAITTTPHVGAHADAPLHYDPAGEPIGAVDLTPYLGPCRVVHALGCGPLITWAHVAHAMPAGAPCPPRLLVRTYAQMPQQVFDEALPGFDPALLERLADRGVCLIGTDSASVDPAASKTLDAHQVLRRRGLRVLENLCLDAVPEGDYELIALPLKWMSADASPVRAVLRALA